MNVRTDASEEKKVYEIKGEAEDGIKYQARGVRLSYCTHSAFQEKFTERPKRIAPPDWSPRAVT
jgi:hypothetical protein